jgi:hypothetical protein
LDVFFREAHEEIERICSCQREKLEGSMEEGYISYGYFYYVSEYIKNIDNTPGVVILDDKRDEDKR